MRHSAQIYRFKPSPPKPANDNDDVYGGVAIIAVVFSAICLITSLFVIEPNPVLSARGDFGLASMAELAR